MASEMMEALMMLCQEKHIDELYLLDRLEQSLAASYANVMHLDFGAKVTIDRTTGKIYVYKLIPKDDSMDEEGNYTEFDEVDVTPKDTSRIAAQHAKAEINAIVRNAAREQIYHLPLPRFTLVGATTRAGQLSAPLRDRFGVVLRLELYEPKELAKIVTRSAGILGIDIEADGALEIASRSRGTPRIANRMLKRVRDFAQIMSDGVITYSTAKIALDRLEIDELGLDSGDRRMLNAIIQYYNGGPVGVETLAAAIGEEAVTIEDVVEPYLMQIGFLQRTPRGRCATRAAYLHLGLTPPGTVADDNPRFDV